MRIKFHGGRGSHPVSVEPRRVAEISSRIWDLSQKNPGTTWSSAQALLAQMPRAEYQIYGGHTTCIELKSDDAPMPIFFDAGTGLTAAGMDLSSGLNAAPFAAQCGKAAIFFSHTHWDHISGLPTLAQLYHDGNEFHFYGVHKRLEQRLAVLFQDEYFPVPFHSLAGRFHFHQIELGQTLALGKLNISHFAQTHPGGSFAYRVQGEGRHFVFATDTELKNIQAPHLQPGANIYTGADLLVLDAHFSPEDAQRSKGWGHANIHTAVDLAVREQVKKLCLFHQSPFYSDGDIEEQLRRAQDYRKQKHADSTLKIMMMIEGDEIQV